MQVLSLEIILGATSEQNPFGKLVLESWGISSNLKFEQHTKHSEILLCDSGERL